MTAPDATGREFLDRFLRRAGATPCPSCRQSVPAGIGMRCPHCRTRLALGLDRSGANGGAWLAGLIAAGIGTGFFGALCGLLVPDLLDGGLDLPNDAVDRISMLGGIGLSPLLLAAWFFGRRRIRRWPPIGIRIAAFATAGLMLGLLTLMAWR